MNPQPHRRLSRFNLLWLSAFIFISLLARAQQPPATSAPETMMLNVTVADKKGRHLNGLSKENFTVLEGKQPREITFFSQQDSPLNVGILIDRSGSIRDARSSAWTLALKDALARFVLAGHEKNMYFFAGFNQQPQLLIDWTRDAAVIAEGLNKLDETKPKGQTALYDTCALALENVVRGPHSKRVLLIVSDGQDNTSRLTFTKLRHMIQASNVLIYSIGFIHRNGSTLDIGGQAILEELAYVSGGKSAFPENKKELGQIFDLIALELRHQYLLGFMPANLKAGGKWNEVKIKVDPPPHIKEKLYVHSRGGYFSPPSAP